MTDDKRPFREIMLEILNNPVVLQQTATPVTESSEYIEMLKHLKMRRYSEMQQISPEPVEMRPNRRDRRREKQSQKRKMKSYFKKLKQKKP